MYQRLSSVLFPVVTIALVGTALWGYQEHQDKNRILVKAENQYQRAFHDLSYHVNKLNEELGNSLALSSASKSHQKGLVNIWRLTNQAQSEVNQLPLTLMPFHETEELLANLASFSYKTAMRDLDKNPLTDSEMKVLNQLYSQSKEIKKDLQKVQEAVINDHLQWMDVETILASGKENFDNDIIDGFKLMNKRVAENGDVDWGPSVSAMNRKMSVKSISGPMMTAEQIKEKAIKFLGMKDPSTLKVVENGKETDWPTYSVTAELQGDDLVQLDYSKKGGKLIYYMRTRAVAAKQIDVEQAADAAEQFLQKHEYPNMKPVMFDEYNHTMSITFARVVDGVVVYPDKLSVKVALDNAEVIGLSAGDLLYTEPNRQFEEPAMTEADARTMLNPQFKVEDVLVAWIRNDMDEEVLCYEYQGSINGGKYRIYLNADNGFEEKIEHISDIEAKHS